MVLYQTLLEYLEFQDIEYVLTAVREIVRFSKTLGGKFCVNNTDNFGGHAETLKEFEGMLENEIFKNYSWNHSDDKTIDKIFSAFFNLIKKHGEEIIVFTTNYDRSIEEYCSNGSNKLRCIDGFYLDQYNNRFLWAKGDYGYMGKNNAGHDVFLYKIHGSLNWKKHTKYGIERTTYERKPEDSNYDEDFLIYPTLSPKDEAEGKEPYNTILKKFDEKLKSLDICIVIGFSFRDKHVNEKMEDFVNEGKTLIVLGPSGISDFRINVLKQDPAHEELKKWKQSEILRLRDNIKNKKIKMNVHFIQKKLEAETIDKIIHDIERSIEPEKDMF